MRRLITQFLLFSFLLGVCFLASSPAQAGKQGLRAERTPPASFVPLERWRTAVLQGDSATLKDLYSANPAPSLRTPEGTSDNSDKEVQFWTALKGSDLTSISFEDLKTNTGNADAVQVTFQAVVTQKGPSGPHKVYIASSQVWARQGDQWRIINSARSNPARLRQPLSKDTNIYPAGQDARAEIKEALERAAREHKRVIVVFGANWCYDCHVLDKAFHSPELSALVQKNYEVIHVDVGQYDRNLDLAGEYQVPLKKGIPALAVLDRDGKLLYSQQNGEFEAARSLGPEDLTQFLNKWKP